MGSAELLAWAGAGGHQNPEDQAGSQARASKEAAAHIFGRTTSEERTVHDIATPDIKQRMADTSAVLSADAAQKALEVRHCPVMPHLQASRSPNIKFRGGCQFPIDCTSTGSPPVCRFACSKYIV